ncbi:MAG TPA: ShlB/FhaC/HecB family hemolysin secretion/activation protein [Usitatibacter sp.]|nr:ShlB/FhaC/HecB family hemolysin secretion/activation protein [Usitatibacter sp.]
MPSFTRFHLRRFAASLALALLLLPHSVAAASPLFDVTRFDVNGNTLLTPAEIDGILAPFKGPKREFADVQAAVDALQAAYVKHGFTLVRVTLPEQELDAGVVRFQVIEKRIGRVVVEGNTFHDEANIRRSLPALVEGTAPNLSKISASLAQANENPSKRTTLELKDGARDSEVDAKLAIADEKTWSLALNVDNTGLPETGRTMMTGVYQNANITGRDDVLSLQYTTTAEKPGDVHVYGAGYHLPLYSLGDSIDAYAVYSDVDSGTVLVGILPLLVSGKGTVAGARFNHSFGNLGPVESMANVGFEEKAYKNDVSSDGTPLGSDITVRPLSLGYVGTWKAGDSTTAFTLTLSRNLPGGDHGSAEDFERARAGANPDYLLARYGFAYTRVLPLDWQFRFAGAGQYSSDALVPGEQFGAGGMGSVRGFETRQVTGDKGISGSVELYTPNLCGALHASTFCRALVFYDGAHVARNDALPGELSSLSIGSVGAGLRASLGRYVTAQLDFGHVVEGDSVEPNGHNKFNFKVGLTY